MLKSFGVTVEERVDGMEITGKKELRGGIVQTHGDHRIAMAGVIGGLLASGETMVQDVECIATSYPDFVGAVRHLCGDNVIEEVEE
jgi:3-phosphoshikimate 1-carboxyvinyltransferase